MMAEWPGVTIEKKSVVDGTQSHVTIEWTMSSRLDSDWIKAFDSASQPRSGMSDFVFGPGPRVVNSAIRWLVPETAIEAACLEVEQRVSAANERFKVVLERRAADRAQKDEAERIGRQRMAEAQARLDKI